MKKVIFTLILASIAQNVFAELSTDDFNQMIQENQRSEADLRKKLQKDAGINLKKEQYGKIDQTKIEKPQGLEQVASSGGGSPVQRKTTDSSSKELQRSALKRVADEVKEANSN